MCQIVQKVTDLPGGKISLDLTCSISGKPITISNRYGMFCEDMCELEENKKASKKLANLLKSFEGITDDKSQE